MLKLHSCDFSIASQLGSIVGPQLIYIRKYWHSAPYLGVVITMMLATLLAGLFLPETKSEVLQDTVHDAKRRRLAFEKPILKGSIKLDGSECSKDDSERVPLAKN